MSSNIKDQSRVFAEARIVRSFSELLITLTGYCVCVYFLYLIYTNQLWLLYVPVCLIGSFFMIKIFALLHDCSHGSMFKQHYLNVAVGRLLSLFLTVPFTSWKTEHEDHHSHVVDMEKIKHGDVTLYTVAQYKNLPQYKKLSYKIFRHPFFFLFLAPFLYFFIKSRIPAIFTPKVLVSVFVTNIFVACIYLPLFWIFGFWTVVFVFAPSAYIGGMIGVVLFYLQHDYPEAQWFTTDKWHYEHAALQGSSLIRLPQPLEWFSHAIGYHHIHHLNSKIPGYRLRECFDAVPDFQNVHPLTWKDVKEAFYLKLWSYEKNRFVRFSEIRDLKS